MFRKLMIINMFLILYIILNQVRNILEFNYYYKKVVALHNSYKRNNDNRIRLEYNYNLSRMMYIYNVLLTTILKKLIEKKIYFKYIE